MRTQQRVIHSLTLSTARAFHIVYLPVAYFSVILQMSHRQVRVIELINRLRGRQATKLSRKVQIKH